MGKPTGLAKNQQRALGRLTALPALEPFYLAGGSAIAWHLHHRRSRDLDLFSVRKVDLATVERSLKTLPDVKILVASDVALKVELDGTLVDIVAYPYPPLQRPSAGPAGCKVASLLDLAAMKLGAVARRGIRRDFWDLRVLMESGLSLEQIAQAYLQRFQLSEGDLYPVFRALTYFEDAEKDATFPQGMTARLWADTKRFFMERVGEDARALLAGDDRPKSAESAKRRKR